MAWSTPPAPRSDLIFEGIVTLNDEAQYISEWFDTADTDSVRVTAYVLNEGTTNGLWVTNAIYDNVGDGSQSTPRYMGATAITVASYVGYAEVPLGGRFFQVSLGGGVAGDLIALVVRKARGVIS